MTRASTVAALVACALMFAARDARADYYVDCGGGDDANSGSSPVDAWRSLNFAMAQLPPERVVVHVASGACPSEGGIKLRARVELVGAGSSETIVNDSLYFGYAGYQDDRDVPHDLEIRDLRFSGGTDTASQPERAFSLVLDRVVVPSGTVAMIRDRAEERLSVTDSVVDSIVTYSAQTGHSVGIRRTTVNGTVSSLAGSESDIRIEESTLSHLVVKSYMRVDIARSVFRANAGLAITDSDNDRPGYVSLRVSSCVFDGYDGHVVVGHDLYDFLGPVRIENNTFHGARGPSVVLVGMRTLAPSLEANIFDDSGAPAVVVAGTTMEALRWNNVSGVSGDVACIDGVCYPSVDSLDRLAGAAENTDGPPDFRDVAGGDFRLEYGSRLIDGGQPDGAILLQPLDLDGFTRPADGDGDGIAASDVGAFEFVDGDRDSIPELDDNCPTVFNPSQEDEDDDGVGDRCEPDDDADGVANDADSCRGTPIGAQVDPANGCSLDQTCPCAGPPGGGAPWRDHGDYVACVADAASRFRRLELNDGKTSAAALSTAARSECGRR